jgi:DNA-directed RNA polymerase specialized sigma24 family protein
MNDEKKAEYHLIIWEISNNIAPKYAFANFTAEDLIQEAYIMGMDALTRYDGVRPFRNFIANHISNRMKTFKRDHYYRPNAGTAEHLQVVKRALMSPGNMDKVNKMYEIDYANIVQTSDNKEILDKLIPVIHRKDYLRMLANVRISHTRKKEIVAIIKGAFREIYGR